MKKVRIISKQNSTGVPQIEICLVRMNSCCPYFQLLGKNTLR